MKRILFFNLLFLVLSCSEDDKGELTPLELTVPKYFPKVSYNLSSIKLTEEGFQLGKELFNDPILSRDYSVACSNCHVKGVAFTDPQHGLSIGVENRIGKRNAPSIANMAFMKEFMWDGGVIHLDFAPPNAIENPLEMDISMAEVVKRLNGSANYRTKFKQVFNESDSITSPLLLKALSQYQLMLISASSNYDKEKTGGYAFTDSEKRGKETFKQKCAHCHSGELFTNQSFENNGLDMEFKDIGRGLITENKADDGKFKIPSLRNVALTAPYMHDGRFSTLEAVLDHYSDGVKWSMTLSDQLNKNGSLGIKLSSEEKSDLKAFLKTLTDHDFIKDSRF